MKITELIFQKVADVRANPTGAIAEEIKSKAVAATLGGFGTPAWTEYMRMFTETDAQLERLTSPPDPVNSPKLSETLAYLVANGVVGTEAFLKLEENPQALAILDELPLDTSLSGEPTKTGKP